MSERRVLVLLFLSHANFLCGENFKPMFHTVKYTIMPFPQPDIIWVQIHDCHTSLCPLIYSSLTPCERWISYLCSASHGLLCTHLFLISSWQLPFDSCCCFFLSCHLWYAEEMTVKKAACPSNSSPYSARGIGSNIQPCADSIERQFWNRSNWHYLFIWNNFLHLNDWVWIH